jgi:hypothetical protein
MRALNHAFPKLVGEPVKRGGDWAALLRGVWFYYADGRLLPESLRARNAEFSPQPFYRYAAELPEWKTPSNEEVSRYVEMAKNRSSRTRPSRTYHFYDELWNIHDRAEAWNQVKTLRFLGKEVLVHHAILEPLALVEQKINAAALRDTEVANWKNNIASVTGWNWRNIADNAARSNHSYGIAIDILPKTYSGETYWLWAVQKKLDWWNIPYSKRYHPPLAVIKIFEEYGFIWGGKWTVYDTMHFEYRPEILIFSDMPLTGEY